MQTQFDQEREAVKGACGNDLNAYMALYGRNHGVLARMAEAWTEQHSREGAVEMRLKEKREAARSKRTYA